MNQYIQNLTGNKSVQKPGTSINNDDFIPFETQIYKEFERIKAIYLKRKFSKSITGDRLIKN